MPEDRTGSGTGVGGSGPGGPSTCPICDKPRNDAWRPFCSKRCADIDLGRWLGGRYAIPGEPADPDASESGSSG